MAMALPIMMAAGTVMGAAGQNRAANANANFLNWEGQQSSIGYDQNYAAQLRKNAVMMGAGTAAAAQSGGGTGGSTKGVLDQNALNANLDALNIKYGGIIRKETYDTQAGIDTMEGTQASNATLLRGSAALLRSSGGVGGWSLGAGTGV